MFLYKTEEVTAAYYLGWINICPSFHPLAKSDSLFTHCRAFYIYVSTQQQRWKGRFNSSYQTHTYED